MYSPLTLGGSTGTSSLTLIQEAHPSVSRPWIESRTHVGPGEADYVSDIVYYNGLGLPFQSMNVAASGTGRNIVTPFTYDSCMRGDAKEWLPFEPSGAAVIPLSEEEVSPSPRARSIHAAWAGRSRRESREPLMRQQGQGPESSTVSPLRRTVS